MRDCLKRLWYYRDCCLLWQLYSLFFHDNGTFLILQVNRTLGLRAVPARCWALWRCTIHTLTPGPLYNPCYRAGACLALWFISEGTPERMTIRATCETRAGLGLKYMYLHVYTYISHLSISYECWNVNDFVGQSCNFWFSQKSLSVVWKLSHWLNKARNHDFLEYIWILTTNCSIWVGRGKTKGKNPALLPLPFYWIWIRVGIVHIHQNEAYEVALF